MSKALAGACMTDIRRELFACTLHSYFKRHILTHQTTKCHNCNKISGPATRVFMY
jgi:hypothetical protein